MSPHMLLHGSDSYFATSLYKNGSGYAKVQNRTEDDNDFGSGMSVIASLSASDTVQVVQHNVNLYGTSSSDENISLPKATKSPLSQSRQSSAKS